MAIAVIRLVLDRAQDLDLGLGILVLRRGLLVAGIALRGLRRLLEALHLQVLLVVELPAELEFALGRQIQARGSALGPEPRGVLVADPANGSAALDLHEIE